MRRQVRIGLVVLGLAVSWGVEAAKAGTEEEMFRRAEAFIQEAESNLRPDTAGLIKQQLAEAEEALRAAGSATSAAGAPAGTSVGRYSWSPAALQALWAESVAREVIFRTTGMVRWWSR